MQTFLIHTIQQDSPHGLAVDTGDLRADSISRVNPPHQSSVMTTHDIFSNIAQGPTVQEVGELYETWLILEYCDRGSLSKVIENGFRHYLCLILSSIEGIENCYLDEEPIV